MVPFHVMNLMKVVHVISCIRVGYISRWCSWKFSPVFGGGYVESDLTSHQW